MARVFKPKGQQGRNDPCGCGSGKKYKKCCLTKHLKIRNALSFERDEYAKELITGIK
jgi:hypothetical protein